MDILKLSPVFKDYIWGGTRLRDDFKMKTDIDPVAEGWMLACHKDGMNTVDGGEYDISFLLSEARFHRLKFSTSQKKSPVPNERGAKHCVTQSPLSVLTDRSKGMISAFRHP